MNISLVIAYVIAIAIPLFSVYLIFALDLFGTGKLSTVLVCALWGGIGAFGLAYPVNSTVMMFVGYVTTMTLTGPIAEEILKSLVMYYFITRPSFRYVVDGAIYGFAAGIGFAVTENLFYLSAHPEAGLSLALSRVLSTSLMHATTSALIGISLGHLRRSQSAARFAWALIGFVPAMVIHIVFNNAVNQVTNGTILLLIGIAIGMGGAALVALLISQGIAEEKRRFSETLGLGVGVSAAERKAVQELGGSKIEQALQELSEFFGDEKVALIRRLLVTQANIGILQNNLNTPVSDRLRKAWQDEIAAKHAEIDTLRGELGVYVMTLLRGVFPDDTTHNKTFQREFASSDLTVHKFDLFMNASQLAGTVPSDELGRIADLLKQIDIFKEVSLPDLENLSRAITTRTFGDGDMIFEEGDPGDTMYLIEQGAIMLFNKVEGGTEHLLNTCYPGGMVGELGLLDGYPRSARARASGGLRVFILRREHFMMFIQSRPRDSGTAHLFSRTRAPHFPNCGREHQMGKRCGAGQLWIRWRAARCQPLSAYRSRIKKHSPTAACSALYRTPKTRIIPRNRMFCSSASSPK